MTRLRPVKWNGRRVRPKIVASTATAHRAEDQVQAIFGRALTADVPARRIRPAGLLLRAHPASGGHLPRAATSASPHRGGTRRWLCSRVLLTLAGASAASLPRRGRRRRTAANPADPYMTLLAYFNALRELGGGRRIIEEQVQNTLRTYGEAQADGRTVGASSRTGAARPR